MRRLFLLALAACLVAGGARAALNFNALTFNGVAASGVAVDGAVPFGAVRVTAVVLPNG